MKNNFIKEIGKRLRTARQNAGYKTILDFTNKHKFPKSTYTQYETGVRSLKLEQAIHFSVIFKTNLIWLISGKGSINYTDNDLINNLSDRISQEEFLSILSKKKNLPIQNNRRISQESNKDDVHLLSHILAEIIGCYETQSIPLNFKLISETTFGLYFDVISVTQNKQKQKHFIDSAISTFNRIMKVNSHAAS